MCLKLSFWFTGPPGSALVSSLPLFSYLVSSSLSVVCLSFRGKYVGILHFNGLGRPSSGPLPIERQPMGTLSVARNLKGIWCRLGHTVDLSRALLSTC